MTVEAAGVESPSVADIRAELDCVLASPKFVACPRLADFLRFVVETVLDGQGDRLKGYTVGVEALGRSADFDPQTDPIVRVEAGRLRRALARYYEGQGASDPVRIELAPVGYVPQFRRYRASLGSRRRAIVARHFGTAEPRCRKRRAAIYSLLCAGAILVTLEILFDIDNPLHGGPNNGLYGGWTAARAPPSAA